MANINIQDNEFLWNEIEAFLAGSMEEEARHLFTQRLEESAELREMVAFSRALDIKEGKTMVPKEVEAVINKGEVATEIEFMEDIHSMAALQKMFKDISAANTNPPQGNPPDLSPGDPSWFTSMLLNYATPIRIFAAAVVLTVTIFTVRHFLSTTPDQQSTVLPAISTDVRAMEYSFGDRNSEAAKAYRAQDFDQAALFLSQQIYALRQMDDIQESDLGPYLFFFGVSKFKEGKLEEAKDIFINLSEAKESVLDHPEYLYLGLIYYHEEDFERAKDWLQQARESDHRLDDGTTFREVATDYLLKIEDRKMQ